MIKKFRAWDTQQKRMSLPFNLGDSCLKWQDGDIDMPIEFGVSKNRLIIQQFTGLTDSIGKEIYEGDIVDNLCSVGCARFKNGTIEGCIPADFSIEKSVFKEVKCVKDMFFCNVVRIGYHKLKTTVVGNIFQNPELLEKC